MARGIHRLTALQVAKAARKGVTVCDGGGLYLQNGSSWIFRYTRNRKSHYLGLGPLSLVDLQSARAAAYAQRRLLFEGVDPLAGRRARRVTTLSFADCVAAYLAAHSAGWKNPKHRAQWEFTLRTYAMPLLGRLPVREIDTALVLQVLEPIWKTKPETASRLRSRIERVISWAVIKGYRDDTPNPARWTNNIDHLLPSKAAVHKVIHHPALAWQAIPQFVADLRRQDGVAARALEFIIYTATRTGDVIGQQREDSPPLLWTHLDLAQRLWTIPRTKTGTTHKVPLSDPAIAVLEAMRSFGGAIVFPGRGRNQPLSDSAMRKVLQLMGRDDVTVHGARASFKTWASETTDFQRDVIEACLTHSIGDRLEKAYRRSDFFDKRVQLMRDWSNFCASAK